MNIRNYINDYEFKMIILNNKINIVNYESIILLSEDKIVVTNGEFDILINGQNLSILKLLDKELLISGVIKNIEFR